MFSKGIFGDLAAWIGALDAGGAAWLLERVARATLGDPDVKRPGSVLTLLLYPSIWPIAFRLAL